MGDRYMFVELSAGRELVNAARVRALKEFTPIKLSLNEDTDRTYLCQCFEDQEGFSIRVHRDATAEAVGPVVFSSWKKRLVFERPDYAPPIRFNAIEGPVTISRPAEFAALPENYDGKVFLRLSANRWGGGHEDAHGVRAWLSETLAKMLRANISNAYIADSPVKAAKKKSPPQWR